MLTKDDISKLRYELRKDFITRSEMREMFKHFTEEIIEFITDFVGGSIAAFREETLQQAKVINDITENHEKRLDNLEDKVFN